ncbi:MAG TPA: ATP-binding protein [Candidatus Limnocylindrales bacterium]|nr:ATP-binding protein [Candidatus Limnocylindrales bacterium]
MSIQVHQVKGDIIELIFNPREDDLRVGENLCILERGGHRGIIVQIIEFRMVTYPSLIQEQIRLVLEDTDTLSPELLHSLAEASSLELAAMKNLNIAVAKIRKLAGTPWDRWDGWIPTRDVEISRVNDQELFANCISNQGNLLRIGQTLYGEPFYIEGQDLEKVNIITGVKGSGKSYLSKVLLLQLIEQGAPCVVFDINKEYIHLPRHEVDPVTGQVLRRGIIHLKAGGNLKLGIRQFGLSPLLTMLTKFGLPEVSAMYLENRVFTILEEAKQMEAAGRKPPFLSIRHLIQMAEAGEFSTSEVVNGAIRSRLESARNTGVFASTEKEAISLRQQYQAIREGGALIIDVSDLTNLARFGFVQAIIDMIKDICEEEIALGTERFPFVFFEEAHLYISKNTIGYIVTRSRHLGITSFFVTNMIAGLDESVLRQADNLFLLYLPFDDDVKHISKSAMTDKETMASFVRRLRSHHCLALGNVTSQYPVIFKVQYLEGIHTAGETKYFFKPREPREGRPPLKKPQPQLPLTIPLGSRETQSRSRLKIQEPGPKGREEFHDPGKETTQQATLFE